MTGPACALKAIAGRALQFWDGQQSLRLQLEQERFYPHFLWIRSRGIRWKKCSGFLWLRAAALEKRNAKLKGVMTEMHAKQVCFQFHSQLFRFRNFVITLNVDASGQCNKHHAGENSRSWKGNWSKLFIFWPITNHFQRYSDRQRLSGTARLHLMLVEHQELESERFNAQTLQVCACLPLQFPFVILGKNPAFLFRALRIAPGQATEWISTKKKVKSNGITKHSLGFKSWYIKHQ